MPTTPIYGIQYPCESPSITLGDFQAFATTTEAAIALTDAEATAVTHNPNARGIGSANPALGVDTVMTFTAFPGAFTQSGFTVNTAAGTFQPLTSGLYTVSVRMSSNQATLTMTSQRVAVNIGGVLVVATRNRGTNPASNGTTVSSFTSDIFLLTTSVVTFSYLWTGTGALLNPATATVALDLIATP